MIFFETINNRLESSKQDSDVAYFYDLLLYGEFLTKATSLFLASTINDDKERTRYRQEYALVRANSIGDFAKAIDEIVTGPPAQLITSFIRDYELKELLQRASKGDWQYEAQHLLYACLDVFNINHDPLPIKSPLRNWFSTFAHFRNKTRGHGAPTISKCTQACVLLEKSINLIVKNFSAYKRPWAYLHQNLSGKYRVSWISSRKTTDFDFLKREKDHLIESGIYCYLDQARKINLFYSNPELTDFYITNGNLKSNQFECISYITDERIYTDASNYIQPISSLPASHTEGKKEIDAIGNSFTNLPKPTDEYIERPLLEEELRKVLLDDDRFPVITMVGRGGIGKTSLALNVVKEFANTDRYNLIVWFSSRDIDLLVDGPKQVQTKVLNQKDIAKEFCSLVFPGQDINDKLDFFSKEITKSSLGKALYVFDNFETLTNPLEIYEWLNTFIRNPNKVLITSRINRNFKADYPIEVQGMSEPESRKLISLLADKFGISHLLTPRYIDEIINESDGHPYIIKILLGEVAKSNKLTKIERIVAEKENILIALFKRTFNTLSPAAKRVFLTLSSWNSIIPSIALEAVLWRPENEKIDVQGAVEELRKSSFIDVIESNGESVINVPLVAAVFGKGELEVYPDKFKIIEDKKLLMEFGALSQASLSSGLASRIEGKFKAVARRVANLEGFKRELPTLEYIALKFPKAYSYIIEVFLEFEDYGSAKYYLREYLKSPISSDLKGNLWLRLANICKLTNDWPGESHALLELATLPNMSFSLISDSAKRINDYFYWNPNERQLDYQILLDTFINAMKTRMDEATATDYSRLAWLQLSIGHVGDAKETVNHGLGLDPTNQYCLKLSEKLVNR